MRYYEISEQGTIGSTPYPQAGGSSVPSTAAPGAQQAGTGLSGNVQQLGDPRMQAAQLAKDKQAKAQQRQAIQQQIAALQRQLADLNRTT